MLEPISVFVVSLAAAVAIIAEAVTSLSVSIAAILAAFVAGLLSFSGLCGAAIAIMPHPTEEGWYHKVHHFMNMTAMNVGNAANKVSGVVKEEVE